MFRNIEGTSVKVGKCAKILKKRNKKKRNCGQRNMILWDLANPKQKTRSL